MTENKNYTNAPQEEEEVEIDLMEYARKLWDARKLLLKVAGIAAVVGIVIAFSIPKQYTVSVSLSPETTRRGTSSSLSSMASMLGFGNLGTSTEANALNALMTSDIVATTPFVLELFDIPVKTIDNEVDTTLVAYLETEKRPWWGMIMALPGQAIGGIRSLFADKSEEVEETEINPFQLTRKQMLQAGAIRRTIAAEVDKKTGMTQISVTLQDPLVAATLADSVVNKLQKYITKYKVSKAQEDCKYWEQLYNERQKEYYEKQKQYAIYVDENKNVIKQSVLTEQERLQNEMNLAYQVYSNVAIQLQTARAKVQEEKPVFAVLEPASVPLLPSGTSRKIILVGVVFLALVGTSAWILFGQSLWNTLREGLNAPKDEAKS